MERRHRVHLECGCRLAAGLPRLRVAAAHRVMRATEPGLSLFVPRTPTPHPVPRLAVPACRLVSRMQDRAGALAPMASTVMMAGLLQSLVLFVPLEAIVLAVN